MLSDNERNHLLASLERQAELARYQVTLVTELEQELEEAREQLLEYTVTVSVLEAALNTEENNV